jgi:hypothetical protein
VPEAVSVLLALVCTVAIVTLFLWPLWAPLLRARGSSRRVDRGDFTRADAAAARLLDRHGRSPRHSAG